MGCKLIFGLPFIYHSRAVRTLSKNLRAAISFYAPGYDTEFPHCGPKNIRRHRQNLISYGDQVTRICASLPDYRTFYLRRS